MYDGIGAYIREYGKLLLRLAAWERLVGWARDMLLDHNIKLPCSTSTAVQINQAELVPFSDYRSLFFTFALQVLQKIFGYPNRHLIVMKRYLVIPFNQQISNTYHTMLFIFKTLHLPDPYVH